MTLYRDGEPVSTRRGVSESDAIAQIDLLARAGAPLEAVEEITPPAETGELSLAAA